MPPMHIFDDSLWYWDRRRGLFETGSSKAGGLNLPLNASICMPLITADEPNISVPKIPDVKMSSTKPPFQSLNNSSSFAKHQESWSCVIGLLEPIIGSPFRFNVVLCNSKSHGCDW